jgi:hypothetical protein
MAQVPLLLGLCTAAVLNEAAVIIMKGLQRLGYRHIGQEDDFTSRPIILALPLTHHHGVAGVGLEGEEILADFRHIDYLTTCICGVKVMLEELPCRIRTGAGELRRQSFSPGPLHCLSQGQSASCPRGWGCIDMSYRVYSDSSLYSFPRQEN